MLTDVQDAPYTGSKTKSRRQQEKTKTKAIKDTYFLITWLEGTDGETMYDIVNAKTVVPPEDSGILDVVAGMTCRVSYTDGCYYKAKIVDKGSNIELRKKQKQMEKELDQEAEEDIAQADIPKQVSPSQKFDLSLETPSRPKVSRVKKASKTKPVRKIPASTDVTDSESDVDNQCERYTEKEPKKSPKKRKKNDPISILSSSSDEEEETRKKRIKSPKKVFPSKACARKSPGKRKSPAKKTKKVSGSASARILQVSRGLRTTIDDDIADTPSDSGILNPSDEEMSKSKPRGGSGGAGSKGQARIEKHARQEWQKLRFPSLTPSLAYEDTVQRSQGFDTGAAELSYIKDKVRELEETTKKLNSKVRRQEKEILELKRRTETPSSAMESASDISPFVPKQRKSIVSSLSGQIEMDIEDDLEHVLINSHKVDRLKLQSAKLQPDAAKCALQLLSCLFSEEELVNGNPSGTTTARDEVRKQTIKKLDPVRMNYIIDYISSKWPDALVKDKIMKKLTQKCTDLYSSRKELRHMIHARNE